MLIEVRSSLKTQHKRDKEIIISEYTFQGINCSSFEYDATNLRCVLKEGSERVMDNTTLVRGTDNIGFFQQLCILGIEFSD